MNFEAVRKDTISERLATLAGAIGALEAAIEATDNALQATSADELSAAITAQSQAATRTLALKQHLQQSLPPSANNKGQMSMQERLRVHPQADELMPQFEQIERRLKEGQLNLKQQAQVVIKMQAINRQLLGVLTDVDNHGYNQQGGHSDAGDGRVIAKA